VKIYRRRTHSETKERPPPNEAVGCLLFDDRKNNVLMCVCCKSKVLLRSSESRFVDDFGIKIGFVLRPILLVLGGFQFIFAAQKAGSSVRTINAEKSMKR
jgi:hypothetical protein